MKNRLFSLQSHARNVSTCFAACLVFLFVFASVGCVKKKPEPFEGTTGYTPPPKGSKSTSKPKPYKVMGKWYQPLASSRGFKQRGIASWYGEKFHGRKTSNMETYDMYAVSAAHKTLPFDTYVRVFNLDNDRTIDVRVNDRGPFVQGRVIDLSYAAAKELRMIGPGTAEVKVVALGTAKRSKTKFGPIRSYTPINFYRGKFTIQVGAFGDKNNARRLVKKLGGSYKNVHMASSYGHHDGKLLYRVLVGRASTLEKAEKYEQVLKRKGFPTAFIVAE